MGMGSTPAPQQVNMPPPAAHPSTMGKDSLQLATQQAKQRAAYAEGSGLNNTISTTSQGVLTPATTATHTLLGS